MLLPWGQSSSRKEYGTQRQIDPSSNPAPHGASEEGNGGRERTGQHRQEARCLGLSSLPRPVNHHTRIIFKQHTLILPLVLFLKCILLLFYYSHPHFCPFALPHPAHPTPTVRPRPVACVHGSFTMFFSQSPPLLSALIPSACSRAQACGSAFLVSLFLLIRFLFIDEITEYLSWTGLLHLAQYSPGPPALLRRAGAPSSFLPRSIPPCKCARF